MKIKGVSENRKASRLDSESDVGSIPAPSEIFFFFTLSSLYHRSKNCAENEENVRVLLRLHPVFAQILPTGLRPINPDFGKVMSGGCKSVAAKMFNWSEDLIIGGIEKNEKEEIVKANALRSVFVIASPQEVYERFLKVTQIFSLQTQSG